MKLESFENLKHCEDLEVYNDRTAPLLLYLLKDNNFYKDIATIMSETGYSRYFIKQAKENIKDHIENR